MPDDASFLAGLWLKAVQAAPPRRTREKYAAIGAALGVYFFEMRDSQNREKIANIMRSFPDSGTAFEKRWRFNIPPAKNKKLFSQLLLQMRMHPARRESGAIEFVREAP